AGLWPYAALFAAVMFGIAVRAMLTIADVIAGGRLAPLLSISGATLLAALMLVATGFNALAVRARLRDCSGWTTPPLHPTAITEYLQRQIGLTAGRQFQGLVATLDGIKPGQPADWVALAGRDHDLWEETGSDHRVAGL